MPVRLAGRACYNRAGMPPACVLLVEDQAEVRRMLRAALETLARDLQVIDLPSGEEALLVLANQAVDLAVIDVRLAGMSGLDLARKARRRQPELKVILVTGLVDAGTQQQVAEAGAQAYFYKPIDLPVFLESARACLPAAGAEADFLDRIVEPAGRGEKADAPSLSYVTGDPLPPAALSVSPALDLSSRLAEHCQRLGAQAILLLDIAGQPLAATGPMPEDFVPASWLPAAQALSAGYGAGNGPELRGGLSCFLGERFDLYLAPAGSRAFLMILDGRPGRRLRAAALGELADVAAGLGKGLPDRQENARQPGDPPLSDSAAIVNSEAGADELADLLGRMGETPLAGQALDSFWATAAGEPLADHPENGRLSYEQARNLGLAPEEV